MPLPSGSVVHPKAGDPGGVSVSEQVLYQARIALPSNVQTGVYTAETFAISPCSFVQPSALS